VTAYAARTKYDEPGRAARYARRSARRAAQERRLLERALAVLPAPATVLDAPCGAGRVAALLLDRGARVRCADLSPAMRAEAARSLAGRPGLLGIEDLDLEAPPPSAPQRHDLVVCFRFLHHLPDAASRARVLASLAARSRGHVLVSFHHPVSLHHLARAVRRLVTGRRGDRHAIAPRRLRREAETFGLSLVGCWALAPYLRDLWVALFRVREKAPEPGAAPPGT
jgi:SAM-dependent methyltransferase